MENVNNYTLSAYLMLDSMQKHLVEGAQIQRTIYPHKSLRGFT
jgi:hypothetical protein